MKLEILQKEDIEFMIKNFNEYGLMRRERAARFLDMPLSTFDEFIKANPHLILWNGKKKRYCPKMLRSAFQNAS